MRDDIDALAERLAHVDSTQTTFGYIRISSSKQEQGLSIDAQKKLIQDYCSQRSLGDPFIVTEVSSAGKRMFSLPNLSPDSVDEEEQTESRPRLLLLLGHLSAHKNKNLVVWRLDRLARLGDEREILHQMLLRYQCHLHSTDNSEQSWLSDGDPNNPMTALMRQIFGAFSQYEKAIIEMRMNTGLRYKAAKGGYTGGKPAYGYTVQDNELVIHEVEASRVRYIYMCAKKYQYTIRHIAEIMTNNTPQDPMSRSRVHRVLRSEPLYRGKYKDRYGHLHDRPDLNILGDTTTFDYEEEFHGQS